MSEYVPTPEEQEFIDRMRKERKERQAQPKRRPRQVGKYNFPPGIAPDGTLYPVDEPKPDVQTGIPDEDEGTQS